MICCSLESRRIDCDRLKHLHRTALGRESYIQLLPCPADLFSGRLIIKNRTEVACNAEEGYPPVARDRPAA
ncbi:hypothetical protein CPB84DRAFT_1777452 [Gymnopilus junonius]|uniref:Uncharacterized protein n=1 Tax=Gymnopilus junonius TaxID=109634 RepID=A0A9P5NNR1_GYMJU|nr:hypothetical protein CPB84DRAFT_1777452 [Gymnopilus junonius]